MKQGDKYTIHCYKHNGTIHRTWDEAIILEETEDYIVCANNHVKVTESNGRSHKTKEPAIMFFYKHNWYNIIGQLKYDGVYYYCNLASPYIIEGKTIKYIDYDLDLRVFPDGAFKILDRGEYKYHKRIMCYTEDIDRILKDELSNLISIVRKKEYPFNAMVIYQYYEKYNQIKKLLNN